MKRNSSTGPAPLCALASRRQRERAGRALTEAIDAASDEMVSLTRAHRNDHCLPRASRDAPAHTERALHSFLSVTGPPLPAYRAHALLEARPRTLSGASGSSCAAAASAGLLLAGGRAPALCCP